VKKRFYEKSGPGVNIKIQVFFGMRGHPAAAPKAFEALAAEVCPHYFLGFQGNPFTKNRVEVST
jgi:hypothetical protein